MPDHIFQLFHKQAVLLEFSYFTLSVADRNCFILFPAAWLPFTHLMPYILPQVIPKFIAGGRWNRTYHPTLRLKHSPASQV